MDRTAWKTRSISQLITKRKLNKQQIIDQSALSFFRNLLHRLKQVAIQILVVQQVCNSTTAHDRRATKVS